MTTFRERVNDHANNLVVVGYALKTVGELLVDEDGTHSLTEAQKTGLGQVVGIISRQLIDSAFAIHSYGAQNAAASEPTGGAQ